MRYLSLFSGIEAASVAWVPLGWTCVGVAEIAPFPCRVLAHHYPHVPNLGSVSDITAEQVAALGPIDLVVGGFPCQDLSIAGKRRGLENADGSRTRSGLFFDAMRVVRWAAPRWLVVENVPGMLFSNGGDDFRRVVSEMAGREHRTPAGGWAKCGASAGPDGLVEWRTLDAQWFGVAQRRRRVFLVRDAGDWLGRGPVLLEPESLHRNPPSRSGARQERAGAAPTSDGIGRITDVSGTITTTLVVHGTQDPHVNDDLAHPLTAENGGSVNVVGVHDPMGFAVNQQRQARLTEVAGALTTVSGPTQVNGVFDGMRVRRLTTIEAARLQGFPDDYLDVPDARGKPAADTPKYSALGNSMAVPVMRWIGRRINKAEQASSAAA